MHKMKRLSILLLVVTISLSSCAINQEKEIAEESKPTSFQPEPLDNEWSKWIVGEWEFDFSEAEGTIKSVMKAELGLNGQFLILKYESEISDEHTEELKKSMETSAQEAEKFKRLIHKEIELETIDPKTGEVIGYLFDSLRCIAQGRGKRRGNKEIMEWKWYCSGREAKSVRAIERVSDDKLVMTEKYIAPDGSVWMEGSAEAIRKK
jgi:hypothetical protein